MLKIGRDRGHVLHVVRDSPSLPKSRGAVVQPPPGSKVEAARAVASNPSCLLHLQLWISCFYETTTPSSYRHSFPSLHIAYKYHHLSIAQPLLGNGHGSPGVDRTQQGQRMLTKEGYKEKALPSIIMMLSSASFQKFLSLTVITTIVLSLVYIHTWFVAWTREEAGFPIAVNHEEVEGERGKSGYHRNAGVLKYVNPKIGTYGVTPNGNGGMIPSVGMPFGMTRWTAVTREVCILPAGSSCL